LKDEASKDYKAKLKQAIDEVRQQIDEEVCFFFFV
jgi:hypothetical protein